MGDPTGIAWGSRLWRSALISALLAVALGGTASAQTIRTWNDVGGNVNWSRSQNWSGNALPATNEIAALGSSFQGGSINLQSTSRTVFGLHIIQSGVNTSWTLSGASQATGVSLVSGSLTRFSTVTGTQTLAQPITLGTNSAAATAAVWIIDGADRLIVSSTIAAVNANTSLTKTGTGILELSGSNTFGGAFTINQGTVSIATINNGGAIGVTGTSSSAAANFVLGGGVLQYTGASGTTNRSFTLSNATTSTINVSAAATNLQFSGSTAATTGGLTKTGNGTLTLAGVGGYTGATLVNAGTLALGANNALSASTSGTVSNAALNVGSFSSTMGSLTTTGNTALIFSGSAATAGSLSLGALTLGSGTDTLSVAFSTAPTQARYNLVSYTSRSGTFDTTSITGATGYRLVYGGVGTGTVALAQNANQSFAATSGTTRALVGSTVTVTGTLANTANSGAAELSVSLAGAGFSGFSSSAGSLVAGAANSIVTGTLTAPATPATQNWSMVNTDSLATTTSATASSVLQAVANRTYGPTAIALGRFLSTALPTGTSTITSTGLSGTTASGTVGSFVNDVGNGLTLSLASGTNVFSGGSASQSATYTTGGSYTGGLGALSGTFSATATNEFGGTSTVPVAYSGTAVTQRSFAVTSSTVALGRYLISDPVPSGTTGITSTGSNVTTANASLGSFNSSNGLTLSLTSGSANFIGAAASQTAAYAVSGSATSAGLLAGSVSSSVTAEFGSISDVVVNYTANPVNQRSFTVTSSTIALGRFLITNAVPSGTTGITSTGSNVTTADASLGSFGSSNGLTLSLTSGSATFAGAAASQAAGYTVSGVATSAGLLAGSFSSSVSAEFGSISDVVVNYTANPVNQRVFTTSTTALALGFVHQGGSFGSGGTVVVTSTGLNATTANATLGAFSGGPSGFTLNLSSGAAQFSGAAASQSATYALSGTTLGVISGTFTSVVTGEFSGIPDVSVGVTGEIYSGQSVWATNGGGNWGTFTGSGAGAFGLNWQATQGSPGLDASFANTDTATFGSALLSGTAAIFLDGANPSLRSLTFNNTNGYSIFASSGGSRIILSSTGAAQLNTLSGTHAIHSELLLQSNAVFDMAANSMFEMHGTLSGSGNLTKTGLGTLEFYGNNDFVGNVSITGGRVFIESGTAPFGIVSNPVTISGGAILDLNGKNVVNLMTIVGDGTIINAFNPDYVTNISGTGVVTSGTGPEILGNYSVLPGGRGIFDGRMAATATINSTGRAEFAGDLARAADVTVAASGAALFTGTQGGDVTTSGSSTFAGDVTETVAVSGGFAGFNANTALGSTVNIGGGLAAFAGTVGGIAHVTSASGTATYSGLIASTASIEFINGGVGRLLNGASVAVGSILNDGSILVDRTTNLLLPSIMSGTGRFTNLGSGTTILTGASTFTGPTTITSGAIQLGNGGTAGSLSPSSAIANDGRLIFNRSDNITQGTDFSSAAIDGSGDVVQIGTGAVVLNAINGYTGVTSILSGTISASEIVSSQNGSNIGKPTEANRPVVLANQGTLLYTGASNTYTRGFTLSASGGRLVVESAGTTLVMANGDVTGTGDFTVGGAGDATINAVLEQIGGLRYVGLGVLTLNADNTFTGMANVDSGKLVVADSNGQGSIASSVTVAPGAVLGGIGTISGTIMGGGLVSPGNSPGILTATSFDPTSQIGAAFEFTTKNGPPTYNNADNSLNDVLHLTGLTPITSALTGGNVIDVYVNVPAGELPLQLFDYLEGGFFADGLNAAELLALVENGSFYGWVSTTGTGTRTFNGVNYVPLASVAGFDKLRVTTKYYESQNFGGGSPVSGSVTQFVLVPEPRTIVGVIGAGAMIAFGRMFRRRKSVRAVSHACAALLVCWLAATDVAQAGNYRPAGTSQPATSAIHADR